MAGYPKKRDLDGCFFRVKRGEKWQDVCFTDMTKQEQDAAVENRGAEWLQSLALHLAECLRDVGDRLDIVREWKEEGCES